MIQFNKISLHFGNKTLFKDVTLTLNKGEKCALVGKNGMGKTSFLHLIAQEQLPDTGYISFESGYRIGLLQQHLATSSPTILEEALKGLKNNTTENKYKVESILFGLGFTKEDLNRAPSEFSGGYLIRVHLAKLLASEPDCLLLDEPSNYLDIIAMRWLVKFLRSWRGEFIIISHDREFLDSVCTHTLGVHRQSILKVKGGTESYYSRILQEEEIHERTRVNLEKKKAHLQSFVDRFSAKANKAAQAQSRAKMINKMPVLEKLAALQSLNFNFSYDEFNSHKVLTCDEIAFGYNQELLINQFSFLIENGDKIAIIGKNGKGKSTLLKLLGQIINPKKGFIKAASKLKIGYFGQTHIERLDISKTIFKEISDANPKLSQSEVHGICGKMMFAGDDAKKPINILSGGEKSRVLLGKILAESCNLLLLDEPTNHLDMESVEALVTALEEFPGTVVIVTHCEWILRRVPNKLIVFKNNNPQVFEGDYDHFVSKIGWEEE
jgi:ATP-binding cassette, subfamily F, member 3